MNQDLSKSTVAGGVAVLTGQPGLPMCEHSLKEVSVNEIDFSKGQDVVSAAQKFIIPVPAEGAEPLVYPAGDPRAGEPITDWQGKPVGKSGLVFFNEKDKAWQAASSEGASVVILNQVTPRQADAFYQKISELGFSIFTMNIPQLKKLLDYARLELGITDMYNSDQAFVGKKMTPAREDLVQKSGALLSGLMKRDDRDICQAVHVSEPFIFNGPAVTPQIMERGGVIVKQGNDVRAVQPDVFEATYRYRNGSPISLAAWKAGGS